MAFLRGTRARAGLSRFKGHIQFGRIPPLPTPMVMTDRDDGTLWLLSHSLTPTTGDGLGYFSITDVLIDTQIEGYTLFGPYEGPYIPGSPDDLRLLVRGGYLGYDLIEGYGNNNQARVLSRKGVTRATREIIKPATWVSFGDVLGWQDLEVF